MSVSFPRFSLWTWGAKDKEPVSNGSTSASLATENFKFPFVKGKKVASSSRKVKRKWQSREQRRNIDREFDIVLVPSEAVYLSGSDESEDSDWSIGWLEPHGAEFPCDGEGEDGSFSVIVPCYRPDSRELMEDSSKQFLSALKNLPVPDEFAADGNNYLEQWLSSLQNC